MRQQVSLIVTIFCALVTLAHGDTGRGTKGMVASVHPIATKAGLQAMQRGGNAVDAAVAAALTLGVVDGHNSGLGGGCFILVRRPDGSLLAIDGRETAPAKATRDMFLRDGKADPTLSQFGPLAVGVPGAFAAYEFAIREAGTQSLQHSLHHAADIAEGGFALDRIYADKLQRTAERLSQFEGSREVLLKDDGSPFAEGERLLQPDLATTYRSLAEHGSPWFYRGPLASKISAWMEAHEGILRPRDFANYQAIRRDPIRTTYRDYEIIGFPPPSSGGIHVAQILNILETFDLPKLLKQDPGLAYHIIAEAMKLAFADRAHWLGDADFASVPRGLVSKAYAQRLARRIDPEQTASVPQHGFPPSWQTDLFSKHTTHIAAADSAGTWVAITATVNTTFGSKVIVPGTGIVLNNEMDDFSAQPGAPNAFGLIGAEANAVAPGKRPLSSMSPTIVLHDDKPIMTLGAAGGPKIITQVVLAIVHHLDGGISTEEAVRRARIHHQWKPAILFVEQSISSQLASALKSRGHAIQYLSSAGVTQAIGRDRDGNFLGVADPRVPGQALGW